LHQYIIHHGPLQWMILQKLF